MSKKNVAVVEGKDNSGKDVKVIVKRPSPSQNTEGQMVASKVFNEGIRNKEVSRSGLDKYLREQGLWDDKQQKELETLSKKIFAGERQLARGGKTKDGKKFTKLDARTLAVSMRTWRFEQLLLLAKTREMDSYTVEGKSDNAKFDYFMSVCVFNEDEKSHFKDVEDYKKLNDEEHEYIIKAASELANMVYNYDPDYEKHRAENKFLVEFKFAREDGSLVNDKDELVDVDGNRIDEKGRRVNDDGDYIDVNGDAVDEEGNPIEEFTPFADEEEATKTKGKTTKKTT